MRLLDHLADLSLQSRSELARVTVILLYDCELDISLECQIIRNVRGARFYPGNPFQDCLHLPVGETKAWCVPGDTPGPVKPGYEMHDFHSGQKFFELLLLALIIRKHTPVFVNDENT